MNPTYAVGRYAAAALRDRPRPDALLLSQLLFGEPVRLLESIGAYAKVSCSDDGFEAWVRADQLLAVDEPTYREQCDAPAFNLDLFSTILGNNEGVPVTFGARLTGFDGLRLRHGRRVFNYTGQAVLSADLSTNAQLLLRLARKWLYVPGMQGGRTPAGVGPAALLQLLFRLIDIKLPRSAAKMVQHGDLVDFVVQAQVGDLAYFDDRRGNVNHVGLLFPDSTILHVHDRVRIDAIDHFGIFNYELGRYTHQLRVVKRLLPDDNKPGILKSKEERLREGPVNQLAIF